MNNFSTLSELMRKYDVPTPRYTSYPTVPLWDIENFSKEAWINALRRSFEESNDTKGISLYVHLPFCESLCTYCACNKRITKNHSVEIGYIRSLLKEWTRYIEIFGRKPTIREVHLGGGTPTFFSPENLKWLVAYLLEEAIVRERPEFSFEGHPNNTTGEHLQALFDLGFRRVSFGVQDLDPKVQKTIHRIQPFENLKDVTLKSRAIGYESISFDLIYGLPFQTTATIENTFEQVLALRPDRVAFYSYAHVPWVSPGQRGYGDADLPSHIQKRRLYETGRALLRNNGYADIGMDHFSLPHDALCLAMETGTLHRNFMGYTTTHTDLLVGLGASAISDARYAYAQNLKKVEHYSQAINGGGLAVTRGHRHTEADQRIRECILDIACRGKISIERVLTLSNDTLLNTLKVMCMEGILEHQVDQLIVTDSGRPFIRNICAAFDVRMTAKATPQQRLFSQSI